MFPITIDLDGSFTYSDVVTVRDNQIASVQVYPNPAAGRLTIKHGVIDNGAVLRIVDISGRTLLTNKIVPGSTTTDINVSKLVSGVYVLVIEDGSERYISKFMKR